MKKITVLLNIQHTIQKGNHDASVLKFEKEQGVCMVSDGASSKGLFSDKWAKYLCKKTGFHPLESIKGLRLFIDNIWEEFYEETRIDNSDMFTRKLFEKQGSFANYAACWFHSEKDKPFFRWASYGNSTVMIYDKKRDELFVPKYDEGLFGFLKNKGLINWKEDNLQEKYFVSGDKQELTPDIKVILATDVMAEHLVLSYLVIKSKEEDYWELLTREMKSDKVLEKMLFNNRGAYDYNSFNELLQTWEEVANENRVQEFVKKLQIEKRIAKDDLTLQVIEYDDSATDFITSHDPVIIKSYPEDQPVIKKVTKPVPVVKKPDEQFKDRKEEFINLILDNNITKLYHFTDRSNIALIKKLGGLYSWDYLLRNSINVPMPGGDHLSRMLDSRYGLQDYVRTSFCINHPMKFIAVRDGRIIDPVLLHIDPSVVTFKETLFSDMNATRNGHSRGGELEDLELIKFNICLKSNHFRLSEEDKPYYQAEVMIKEFLPAKYILNLNDL